MANFRKQADGSYRSTSLSPSYFLVPFGSLFAVPGCITFVRMLIDPSSVTIDSAPGTTSDIWFPLLFVAVGLLVAGIRVSFQVVIKEGNVSETLIAGWFFITATYQKELGAVQEIRMTREIKSSGSDQNRTSRIVYPVRIHCTDGRVLVAEPQSESKARRCGERTASLLHLPIVDERDGGNERREANELDIALVDRLDTTPADTLPPAGSIISLKQQGSARHLHLGRPAISLTQLITGGTLLAIPSLVVLAYWRNHTPGDTAPWIFATVTMLIVGGATAWYMWRWYGNGGTGTTIIASPMGLQKGALNFSVEEVEGIVVRDGKGYRRYLHLLTDRKEVKVAHGYDAEELRFLRDQMILGMLGK